MTFAASDAPVTSANGLRIIPDAVTERWPDHALIELGSQPPAPSLDAALQAIAKRFGPRTADLVGMQLEYPKRVTTQ